MLPLLQTLLVAHPGVHVHGGPAVVELAPHLWAAAIVLSIWQLRKRIQ